MNTIPDRVVAEPGVRLRAVDLRDQNADDTRVSARHTRAAHRTWGVGAGLTVWALGGGRVLVEPGVAHTRAGELVVLGSAAALDAPGPATVVLRAECGGPRGRIHFVPAGEVARPEDVPLAVYHPDTQAVDLGDGARRSAHGPGPTVLRAGRVARGAIAAEGSRGQWSARVDFARPFADVPQVFVAAEGPAPGAGGAGSSTVQVSSVDVGGFRITVRHALPGTGDIPDLAKVSAVPMAFTWTAVRTAEPVPVRAEAARAPGPVPCSPPVVFVPSVDVRTSPRAVRRPGEQSRGESG
ncbi:hypothetical protein [Embleya sp. AB8]|uniref:hypothetical protein n=1 Tax=Embleya sp. AB8 TaxID=3156304 RepID=UPI003C76D27B